MENKPAMDFQDSEKYLPAALGSLAYFLYMKFYQGVDWRRALVALLTGVLMSAYLAPEVATWMPTVRGESIGFLVGFMGMKLAEGFVNVDVKGIMKKRVEKPLK